MKTKLFTFLVLAGLVLIPFWLQAQTFTIITTADTLATGDIIITQTDINGHIIDKGLVMPGFSVENDTSVFTFSTPTPPDNDEDVFTDHIDVPGTYGGFLPQDIVFNPHNDKFYVYGYRKVLICDVNLVPEKTIEISNRDDFSVFYSDYHKQMIDVNPTSNEVYCLTLEGSLIAIDEFYNKTVLVPPIENATVLRASMKYCPLDNSVVYFLLFTDEDGNLKTEVLKYMLTDGNKPSQLLANYIIGYDLEFMPFLNSHRIFVATNNGVQVFNPDLTLAGNIESGAQFGHIEALNGLLFCHKTGVDEIVAYSPSGSLIHEISDAYTGIRFMLSDDESNQIYTCGFNSSGNGVKILTESSGTYSFTEEIDGFPNVFGLDQNATQVVACGENEVVYINKVGYSPTQVSCTSSGQMYRVATTNNPNTAAVVQPLNGNAINFGTQQEDVLDIGGQVSATCAKGDKIYVAVHKYNQEGYILVLNGSSGAIVDKIEPAFDFNPVDMFCSDDPEINNDNVYVIYVDITDIYALNRIMFFDVNNNNIVNTTIELGGSALNYLITPNNTVVLGKSEGSCYQDKVYFYTYTMESKYEFPFLGCIHDFVLVETELMDYVVQVDYCDFRLRVFTDENNACYYYEEIYINGNKPEAASFNKSEGLLYCISESRFLYIYQPPNSLGRPFELVIDTNLNPYLYETIRYMFYNPNDGYVYSISGGELAQFYDYELEPDVFYLPEQFGIGYKYDDVVLNETSNELYMNTTKFDGLLSSNKLMRFDFENDPAVVSSSGHYISDYENNQLIKRYMGRVKRLSTFKSKRNVFSANLMLGNTLFASTHNETRRLTGNWDWISFPCMPRLGNEDYGSQSLLANIEELPEYLELNTKDGNYDLQLTYEDPFWHTENLPTLKSTQGYKYQSNPQTDQYLQVYGTVLESTTPINLSSQYENWIGYFLEYPLLPEQAFAGIWDRLTRITTKSWTMYRVNGQMVTPSRVTPIRYGDGLIVEVSEDCTLTWNSSFEPAEDYEYPEPEGFAFNQTAEYVPFYFEMDSTTGIQEIGLTVNDSCVGASVVEPSDSLVEVNAYLQGMPSGVPIEVETYNGFKSAKPGSNDYSVLDLKTGKRISRKVYTGEGRPYYVLSFKQDEETTADPMAILQSPSPNPFSSSVNCSFVLNETAAITMTVHDLQGNPVKTLMQGTYPEGYYETGWTGTTGNGKAAGNGIYIIRLTANNTIIANEKVVLIR